MIDPTTHRAWVYPQGATRGGDPLAKPKAVSTPWSVVCSCGHHAHADSKARVGALQEAYAHLRTHGSNEPPTVAGDSEAAERAAAAHRAGSR